MSQYACCAGENCEHLKKHHWHNTGENLQKRRCMYRRMFLVLCPYQHAYGVEPSLFATGVHAPRHGPSHVGEFGLRPYACA
jgi:hypothetical protein